VEEYGQKPMMIRKERSDRIKTTGIATAPAFTANTKPGNFIAVGEATATPLKVLGAAFRLNAAVSCTSSAKPFMKPSRSLITQFHTRICPLTCHKFTTFQSRDLIGSSILSPSYSTTALI
jgi:hypothetical protein